jgi:hypothetical protein
MRSAITTMRFSCVLFCALGPMLALLTMCLGDPACKLGGWFSCARRSSFASLITVSAVRTDMTLFIAIQTDHGSSTAPTTLTALNLCGELVDGSDKAIQHAGFLDIGLGLQGSHNSTPLRQAGELGLQASNNGGPITK